MTTNVCVVIWLRKYSDGFPSNFFAFGKEEQPVQPAQTVHQVQPKNGSGLTTAVFHAVSDFYEIRSAGYYVFNPEFTANAHFCAAPECLFNCNAMIYTKTLMTLALRFIPDFVFQSWAFWVALIVMIIGTLLWHNGVFGNHKKKKSMPNSPSHASKKHSASGISYSSEGRSGRVHYHKNDASFSLYYEFGGGNCVAWIDIPGTDKWEKITGLPLTQRDAVLNEIGLQVVEDQVSSGNGYFRIEGNALNIYDGA